MAEDIHLAGWTLIPQDGALITTTDGRFSFDKTYFGDRWSVNGNATADITLIQQLGLYKAPLDDSLRQSINMVADVTGCDCHVRTQFINYEIVTADKGMAQFVLNRRGRHWRIRSMYYQYFYRGPDSYPWKAVYDALLFETFPTRIAALNSFSEVVVNKGLTLP